VLLVFVQPGDTGHEFAELRFVSLRSGSAKSTEDCGSVRFASPPSSFRFGEVRFVSLRSVFAFWSSTSARDMRQLPPSLMAGNSPDLMRWRIRVSEYPRIFAACLAVSSSSMRTFVLLRFGEIRFASAKSSVGFASLRRSSLRL
jgi:hypothetical protein